MHCTRSVWTCSWWSFHLYIVSRFLWSRFNKMKTKFTPENLALNVCCMVDICFRSKMATPSLNESGHQRTIGNGKWCTLTSLLILHLNLRTIRSRWVIEIRSKEGIVFFWNSFQFTPCIFNVARTYLYDCWLCFWFAFFRMKDSTDFYDVWHP